MNKDECKQAGVVAPVIDRNKCEGKEDCVAVCPFALFRIGVLDVDERKALSLVGKLKALAHGHKQAFVDKPDECHNCGACIPACPEKAIKLVARAR